MVPNVGTCGDGMEYGRMWNETKCEGLYNLPKLSDYQSLSIME